MSGDNGHKIKSVLDAIPPGALVDSKWMSRHQIADSLYHDYVQRGWFVRLAHGLLLRPNTEFDASKPLDWQVVVASMNMIMEINFHVGGITALNQSSHGHYLPLGGTEHVALYAEKLPGWLSKINANAKFESRSLKLFNDPYLGVEPLKSSGLSFGGEASFPVSSPERAILEALDELPEGAGFDQLDMVFQGLASLSPRKLMALLSNCRKVKVIRLFFVFADRHGHAWLKHLDKSKLDFGKGDRQLVKGGKIHPTYRITVPTEFVTTGQESDDA
ncbi:MAG TPA: hypothetical protein EYG11_20100 [Candidatus Latescibacteria bacterium]|uniref:type IV toxin-antitoxin system AbiEi family antitoxin domain-containing protein n=1 Tax=Henriciella sp. TaxID=1968823 RepID=UPI0017E582CD|nr:type IV toxin-antitoxin system AbiEi family antitoxin domain-containing protein [Henriciella sp.]HIG23703.1 hypothetical protein [Henriciella sp.]HIL11006.1 hypothetical protein [Candidatus Latescibacterota bacterium]